MQRSPRLHRHRLGTPKPRIRRTNWPGCGEHRAVALQHYERCVLVSQPAKSCQARLVTIVSYINNLGRQRYNLQGASIRVSPKPLVRNPAEFVAFQGFARKQPGLEMALALGAS